jgi:RNA polymerase sigma-70 factor (ECF subfamily)
VARIQKGDRAAAAQLYRWYGDHLYRAEIYPRLPQREAAEDALKDTFRTALEKVGAYQQGERSIYFWLRVIAINKVNDHYRKTGRQMRLAQQVEELDHLDRHTATLPGPEQVAVMHQTQELVQQSLSQINERYATALRMRLLEDRSREECAAHFGITLNAFDVLLFRACQAFRKRYPPWTTDPQNSSPAGST